MTNFAEMSYKDLVAQAKATENIVLEKSPGQTPKDELIAALEAAAKEAAKGPRQGTKKAAVLDAMTANPDATVDELHAQLAENIENLRKGYVRKLVKKYGQPVEEQNQEEEDAQVEVAAS